MKLISFQSKEFADNMLTLFNSGYSYIDYNTIESNSFNYFHDRIKDVYGYEDFIYCFVVFRTSEIELRTCLYRNIFKDFTIFVKYYKLNNSINSTLIELDVPEDIGIFGKIQGNEILSEDFVTSQYAMSFKEYTSLVNCSLYEKVLPEVRKDWLVDIYDISYHKNLPKPVMRLIYDIIPRNITNTKNKLFSGDTLIIPNASDLATSYYTYLTGKYVSIFGVDEDYDRFLKSEDYKIIENLIAESNNNFKKFINPSFELKSNSYIYNTENTHIF